jgi:hypothetical protein
MQINYWFRKSTKNPELGNLQAVIKIDGVESKPFSTGIDCEKKIGIMTTNVLRERVVRKKKKRYTILSNGCV